MALPAWKKGERRRRRRGWASRIESSQIESIRMINDCIFAYSSISYPTRAMTSSPPPCPAFLSPSSLTGFFEHLMYLLAKLSGRRDCKHDRPSPLHELGLPLRKHMGQSRQPEGQRLARAGGGRAHHVPARQDDGPALRLDRARRCKVARHRQHRGAQARLGKVLRRAERAARNGNAVRREERGDLARERERERERM